jgi:hypothetical protein
VQMLAPYSRVIKDKEDAATAAAAALQTEPDATAAFVDAASLVAKTGAPAPQKKASVRVRKASATGADDALM